MTAKIKKTIATTLLLFLNAPLHAENELLPMVDYIKEEVRFTEERNIEHYNKAIIALEKGEKAEAVELFKKISTKTQDIEVKKYFALFKCEPEEYIGKIQEALEDTKKDEYVYHKMFLNIYQYNKNPEKGKHPLMANKSLWKTGNGKLKEVILYTETLILLKDYKEALRIFEYFKEVNLDIYNYLLIMNEQYEKSLSLLVEQYNEESKEENPSPDSLALKEWLIMFSSLKTNNIQLFNKYSDLFFDNDPETRDKIISKHKIALEPNYKKLGFSNIIEEMRGYEKENDFFHLENIIYFSRIKTEDLKLFVSKSSHPKNAIKINLKNILHSKDNLYKKTQKYLEELQNLPEELETVEYFNAGLLLAKIRKYSEAIPLFKKSFVKNNLSAAGTLYLTLNRYKKTDEIKIILLNRYIKKIKENIRTGEEYLVPMLETFLWTGSRYKEKEPIESNDINGSIISDYIHFINTKDLEYLEKIKKYDQYIELLYIFFYNIDKNEYKFISNIQDNFTPEKNLFYEKEPIVGETYIKMMKMINFINLEEYGFEINEKLLYNPTYLLNYTIYLAHRGEYNKSASVFESFVNKIDMHLSLREKILYSFINFKSDEDIFAYLVQVNIDNKELNLIKTIHYLNNNEKKYMQSFLKKGTKENLFLFYIDNEDRLFEGLDK